jgi:hypothetical protein
MDASLSLQDVANIITFIAPGYFAIQVYALVYAKKERNFSQLLIESVVFSLPIVVLTNVIWEKLLGKPAVTSVDVAYSSLLLLVALASGAVATYLRDHRPVKQMALSLGLGSPDEDFVKTQFSRLNTRDKTKSAVTVTLKSGNVFSGTPAQASHHSHNGLKYYYFTNLAWFNPKTNRWNEREGGLIIERAEIEYIETPKLKSR